MGSIPLPALDVRPQQQQADPTEQLGQLLRLKTLLQNAPLQTQALQQQVQAGQLENQQRQLQLQDQQTLRSISPDFIKKDSSGNVTGYDYDGFFNKAASSGVSPQTLFTIQKGISDATLAKANSTKTQLENQQTLNNQAYQHLEGLRGAQDPGQRQQLWNAARQWASQNAATIGINPQALPLTAPDDNGLNAIEASLGMHAQQLADAKTTSEMKSQETTANARALAAQTEANKFAATKDPNSPLYAPSQAAISLGTAPGAAQIQTNEVKQAARKAGAEESARMPGEMALAAQRQALSQGDPRAAGQLLVNGDATLSELKARGATPDFIAKTLFAAKQLSNGQYNAQAADAQFQVAKSPENVRFFGSAGSLVAKGGTLDQLANVAKDIPSSQLPALNTIADWEKVATGNGPLAHYASTALGVADDYAKVMGGGQGSDTSRLQALNLINRSASPEARAGAIQGIRDAVNSQAVERIGKNPTMKRMYGDSFQSPGGGMVTVQIPGSPPGQIPTSALQKFRADHPNAQVTQ